MSIISRNSKPDSPWHAGELAIQRSVGVVERMDGPGRNFVRDFLPEQHRLFYPMLPFIVLGAVDGDGNVWATMRAGIPGFMSSPDRMRLDMDMGRDTNDPADAGMDDGDAIGMLGIQLETRRRNRLNGRIKRTDDDAFSVRVGQAFGNCPQYIQQRKVTFSRDPRLASPRPPERANGLDQHARDMIAAADTLFVASYVDRQGGERQVDVSHRGGNPGFVRIGDDGVLTIPDFAGNLFFNTLGNFVLNPRAGLLFVDFASGDMLQMSGSAEVVLDSPEIGAFQGAERLWRFVPEQIVYRVGGLPLRFSFDNAGQSPNAQMTGNWAQAQQRLDAAALAGRWRPFRIAGAVDESTTIRSLYLEPVDGAGVVAHLPGQHLPVRLVVFGEDASLVRTYTLSSAASDGIYRISVKRDGKVSSELHRLKQGDVIEARAPVGDFTVDASERRPAVLLAAGVGITPMIAMLRHIVYEGHRTRHMRPTWLFQAARTIDERAFDAEIAALVEVGQGNIRLVRALSAPGNSVAGRDYDIAGRIEIGVLQARLPFGDYDFYICGPATFAQELYDGLRGLNIADARIHAETFGPSSLKRLPDAGVIVTAKPAASEPVRVIFADTAKEARWAPGSGTLLELAEARGLQPEFSCRSGSCGTCRTRILEGEVTYQTPPAFQVAHDEALICCAVPAEDGGPQLHLSL